MSCGSMEQVGEVHWEHMGVNLSIAICDQCNRNGDFEDWFMDWFPKQFAKAADAGAQLLGKRCRFIILDDQEKLP